MHPASSADFHGRNPTPTQRLQHSLTSSTEDAVPRRRAPASGRTLALGLLVQQRTDVPIGKPGRDRNGPRHAVARLAPEAGGFASAVIINPIHAVPPNQLSNWRRL